MLFTFFFSIWDFWAPKQIFGILEIEESESPLDFAPDPINMVGDPKKKGKLIDETGIESHKKQCFNID